jgi:hypothetical protein
MVESVPSLFDVLVQPGKAAAASAAPTATRAARDKFDTLGTRRAVVLSSAAAQNGQTV